MSGQDNIDPVGDALHASVPGPPTEPSPPGPPSAPAGPPSAPADPPPGQTTPGPPGPPTRRTRPSGLVIGLLAAAAVVLLVVGVVGFALPGSNDAKEEGDRLEQQLTAIKKTTRTAEAGTNSIRDAVSKLDANNQQEADTFDNMAAAFNAAAAQPTPAGFSDPAVRSTLDAGTQIVNQEKQGLTELQQGIAQARETER